MPEPITGSIVTPEWIAAVRTNYGLDTRTPLEAGAVWAAHGVVAGAVIALGHALNRIEELQRLPLATPEMVRALWEAEHRAENLAQENARLSALVSEAGRVEMLSETGRSLLELKLLIDGSVLRLAHSPEEVFRAQVARCMDKFREWKRADDATRWAGGAAHA